MTFVVFDLDGTLYTGHLAQGVARPHWEHRLKRLPLCFYVATHVALWPLWKLGLLSELTGRELWVRDVAWTIRGWTPDEAARAFAWIAQRRAAVGSC